MSYHSAGIHLHKDDQFRVRVVGDGPEAFFTLHIEEPDHLDDAVLYFVDMDKGGVAQLDALINVLHEARGSLFHQEEVTMRADGLLGTDREYAERMAARHAYLSAPSRWRAEHPGQPIP